MTSDFNNHSCIYYFEPSQQVLDLWQFLALNTSQADPCCCSPAWNMAYYSLCHSGKPVFCSHDDKSLLIFCQQRLKNGRIIFTPLEDSWMFANPALGPDACALFAEFVMHCIRIYEKIPLFLISGIQKNADMHEFFYKNHKKFNFYRQTNIILGSASLAGGIDGWFSRRSANHRAKLKKSVKKAKNAGITFERVKPASIKEIEKTYSRMLAIEAKSWKGIARCGMTVYPSCNFYAWLMHYLGINAHIIFARLYDKDIGFIFGNVQGKNYRGQQFSFDIDYASFSLGNVLQYHKLLWLCESGILHYDMGPVSGERMEYKKHWTEEYREIESWIVDPDIFG